MTRKNIFVPKPARLKRRTKALAEGSYLCPLSLWNLRKSNLHTIRNGYQPLMADFTSPLPRIARGRWSRGRPVAWHRFSIIAVMWEKILLL